MTHLTDSAPTPSSTKSTGQPAALHMLASIGDRVGPLFQRLAFMLLALVYLTYQGLDLARGETLGPTLSRAFSRSAIYVGDLLQGDLGQTAPGAISGRSTPVSAAPRWSIL